MPRKPPALTLASPVLAHPLLRLEAAAADLGRVPLDPVAAGAARGAAEALAEFLADGAVRVDPAALVHLKARLAQVQARLSYARTSLLMGTDRRALAPETVRATRPLVAALESLEALLGRHVGLGRFEGSLAWHERRAA